jgi:nucleotide-binding universal stress UspA family protein
MAQSVKRVVVWVEPGTWEACVTAAADLVPGEPDAQILLLYVPDDSEDLLRDARAGLWGRRRPVQPIAAPENPELLADAEALLRDLARDVTITTQLGSGPVERVVTAASENADYLVVGRQGDLTRRGPTSLGKHTRFVIDHAQCRVVIVWPQPAPPAATIPPLPADDPRR